MEDHLNNFNILIIKFLLVGAKVEDGYRDIILLYSIRNTWDHLVVTMTNSSLGTMKFDGVVVSFLELEFR